MAKKKKTVKRQRVAKPSFKQPAFAISQDWTWKFMLLVLIVLGILVFRNYLSLQNLLLFKTSVSSDALNVYYPSLIHEADYLRKTGLPSWSFQIGMGQNDYPGGIFNPFNYPLYLLGSEYLAYGIAYMEFIKVVLAGLFFYLYIRTIGWGTYTAFLGGIILAFTGYLILGTGWYAHSRNVVVFIFMLYGFEQYFKERKWWWFPLSFVFMTASNLYFNLIFLTVYAAFRFLSEHGFQWREGKRFGLDLVKYGTLGTLIMAPSLCGYAYKFMYSPRMSGNVGYEDILSSVPVFSFETTKNYVTTALRFFSNDLLGTASEYKGWVNYLEAPAFYCGLLTLLLVPQVFFFLNKRQKWLYGGLLAIWGLMIIFPYFRYALYAFKGNYYKHALSLFVPVTLLFMAMHAVYYLFQNNGKVHVKTLLVTLAILLIMLFLPHFTPWGTVINTTLQAFVAVFLVLYTLLLMLWNVLKYQRWVKILLLVLVCVEVLRMADVTVNDRYTLSAKEFRSRTGYNDYTLEAIDYLKKNDPGFYRIEKYYSSSPAKGIVSFNDAQVQGYYGTSSYSSHNQNNYVEFLQEVGEISNTDELETRFVRGLDRWFLLQGWASCKYALYRMSDSLKIDTVIYSFISRVNDIEIYRNVTYLPLGFTYDQYQLLGHFRERKKTHVHRQHLSLLYAAVITPELQAKFKDLQEWGGQDLPEMVTYDAVGEALAGRMQAPILSITHHSETRIEGSIQVEKPRLLFLSIPFDAGWSATVNGEPYELHQVNVGFTGILLPAGEHHLVLQYRPPFFYEGWAVFLIGLGLYVFLLYKGRKKRRQQNDGDLPPGSSND